MSEPSPLTDLGGTALRSSAGTSARATTSSHMLETVGQPSLDALVEAAMPAGIELSTGWTCSGRHRDRRPGGVARPGPRNRRQVQMIGLGYYDTVTPPVVVRQVLESPAWCTAYTPYQPEISQGRLEALLNFQTMVADLTGLPTANASLLDESTAAAEAMTLMRRSVRGGPNRLVEANVDSDCLPQTIAVVQTRAEPLGIDVEVADLTAGLPDGDLFGVLLQYPGAPAGSATWRR